MTQKMRAGWGKGRLNRVANTKETGRIWAQEINTKNMWCTSNDQCNWSMHLVKAISQCDWSIWFLNSYSCICPNFLIQNFLFSTNLPGLMSADNKFLHRNKQTLKNNQKFLVLQLWHKKSAFIPMWLSTLQPVLLISKSPELFYR